MSTAPLVHDSLAELPEDRLVDRILADPLWPSEFFHFHGMPSGMVSRRRVSLQTAPGAPQGDIDALFCAPDLPEQSVAYQIKRIKFGINQLRNRAPGKLREFKKLTQQANLLAQMGFWQVYAYAIVVVDAREQNAGRVTFEGLSPEMRSKVYSAVSSASQFFDARVGFGVMDFTQTMDSAPFAVGTHGLDIRRFSKPATQGKELTRWVEDVFSRPCSQPGAPGSRPVLVPGR